MNLNVETSLAAWLRSQPAFDGIPVHTGQSAEEIPADAPVIVAACEAVEIIAGALSKATATVTVATPCHMEIEQHTALTTALRASLKSLPSLASHFNAPQLAGAVLTNLTESQATNRWICTATLVLGIAEI